MGCYGSTKSDKKFFNEYPMRSPFPYQVGKGY